MKKENAAEVGQKRRSATTALWKTGSKKSDANPSQNEVASAVVALRPERGYSGTKPDASAVKSEKALRAQFGQFYDGNKIGNT